jgi:hypothetical protein
MMKKQLYLLACIAISAFAIQSCKKQEAALVPAGSAFAGLIDSPHVTINAHVKQQLINVPNAKFKLAYNWNGAARLDSAFTDTAGNASFILHLNTQANLTITSHCGILLYERKFGPFTDTAAVDTTFRVVAYSPVCDSVPPAEYITYIENGVNHRMVYPGDSLRFYTYGFDMCHYRITKANGDGAGMDAYLETPWIGMMMWAGPGYKYSTTPSVTYTETGTVGQYTAGSFVMDLSHLTPETLDPDTEYKVPGTFRFRIRPGTSGSR